MKAIVLDMDGVLFDTERVGDAAWRKAAKEMGFTEIENAIAACRGLNRTDTRAYFERQYPSFDYLAFHERNHLIMAEMLAQGMPVKLGAYELLEWLKEQKWKIALATSTGKESTKHHLKSAAMTEYYEVIVTGDQVEHSKPHPQIYEIACQQLDVPPAYAYAIEDSPNGIQSAFDANMRVIMVPDMVKPDLSLRMRVVTVQKTLLDVRDYLEQYGE